MVLQDCTLGSRRHANLPGIETDLPSVTQKDRNDSRGDRMQTRLFRSLFHPRRGCNRSLQEFSSENNSDAQIIAKIEDQQGVSNLDEIISASDALMVARGDLGSNAPSKSSPSFKDAVGACQSRGKPVIVATHLLESMIEPRATR